MAFQSEESMKECEHGRWCSCVPFLPPSNMHGGKQARLVNMTTRLAPKLSTIFFDKPNVLLRARVHRVSGVQFWLLSL